MAYNYNKTSGAVNALNTALAASKRKSEAITQPFGKISETLRGITGREHQKGMLTKGTDEGIRQFGETEKPFMEDELDIARDRESRLKTEGQERNALEAALLKLRSNEFAQSKDQNKRNQYNNALEAAMVLKEEMRMDPAGNFFTTDPMGTLIPDLGAFENEIAWKNEYVTVFGEKLDSMLSQYPDLSDAEVKGIKGALVDAIREMPIEELAEIETQEGAVTPVEEPIYQGFLGLQEKIAELGQILFPAGEAPASQNTPYAKALIGLNDDVLKELNFLRESNERGLVPTTIQQGEYVRIGEELNKILEALGKPPVPTATPSGPPEETPTAAPSFGTGSPAGTPTFKPSWM